MTEEKVHQLIKKYCNGEVTTTQCIHILSNWNISVEDAFHIHRKEEIRYTFNFFCKWVIGICCFYIYYDVFLVWFFTGRY